MGLKNWGLVKARIFVFSVERIYFFWNYIGAYSIDCVVVVRIRESANMIETSRFAIFIFSRCWAECTDRIGTDCGLVFFLKRAITNTAFDKP